MLEYKQYTSLLELRFDYENALNCGRIENLWFIFDSNSVSLNDIKPICIGYRLDEKYIKHDINKIYETLKFIPTIACVKRLITANGAKAYVKNDGFGIAYMRTSSSATVFRTEDDKNKIEAYKECSKKYMSFIKEMSLEGGASLYEYSNELKELKDCSFEYDLNGDGIYIKSDNLILSKDKAYCEQSYNGYSKYGNVVYLNENTLLHSIGQFYIYDCCQVFPIKENVALIQKCDECGKYYVKNYAKQRKNICPHHK